jgi:pimeloyl-ACP methyl ester carboxylesterase
MQPASCFTRAGNTVATTGSVGLALADRGHRTWSSVPVLGCIDAPTLVVCGDYDTAVPPANSRILAARIRDARLVTIPAGHDLQLPVPAATVAELVTQFVDSHTAAVG